MAWPLSTKRIKDEFDAVNYAAIQVKSLVQTLRADSAAGPTDRVRFRAVQLKLDQVNAIFQAAQSVLGTTQGIAYVKSQFQNDALDPVAEFTAMRNAVVTLRDWIHSNYPTDATTGADLSYQTTANGGQVNLTFSSAQTAGFRTAADALISTIG